MHRRANPHAWWMPTGAIEGFLRELGRVGDEGCRTAILLGGNDTAKTNFLVNCIFLGLLLDRVYNPWLMRSKFHMDRSRWANYRGANGGHVLFCLFRAGVIDNTIIPELARWAPKGSYTVDRSDKKFTNKIHFASGSEVIIYTPDQNVKQLEGGNADGIVKDEHFSVAAQRELKKRLRGRGFDISTLCPLMDEQAKIYIDEVREMPETQRIIWTVKAKESCVECGTRGYKTHEAHLKDEEETDPEERSARVDGIPMYIAGKVFSKFDYGVHCISEVEAIRQVRQEGATFYAGCDPHDSIWNYIVYLARLKNGKILVLDEWPTWDPGAIDFDLSSDHWLSYYLQPRSKRFEKLPKGAMSPQVFCAVVNEVEKRILKRYTGGLDDSGRPVYRGVSTRIRRRYIDPRPAAAESGQTAKSLITVYAQGGLVGDDKYPRTKGVQFTASKGEGNLDYGHGVMRKLLDYEINNDGEFLIEPGIYFVEERVRNLCYSLSEIGYIAKSDHGGYAGYLDESRVNQKLKHQIDALRYAVQKELPYREEEEVGMMNQNLKPETVTKKALFEHF